MLLLALPVTVAPRRAGYASATVGRLSRSVALGKVKAKHLRRRREMALSVATDGIIAGDNVTLVNGERFTVRTLRRHHHHNVATR